MIASTSDACPVFACDPMTASSSPSGFKIYPSAIVSSSQSPSDASTAVIADSIAPSATVRVIGPAKLRGITPLREIKPTVGFIPTIPQIDEGRTVRRFRYRFRPRQFDRGTGPRRRTAGFRSGYTDSGCAASRPSAGRCVERFAPRFVFPE